jgi:uncharacterized damage-inducible protein DinB
MSLAQQAIAELSSAEQFFNRSISNLTEDHAHFAPAEGSMTVAQQIAHTAQSIDWFMEGAFRPEGFDLDFESHAKQFMGIESLAAAKAWFTKSIADAKALIATKSDAELMAPLPPGPVMGGAPRMAIFSAITDHTAHHRGALTVYARLNKLVPPMPYM